MTLSRTIAPILAAFALASLAACTVGPDFVAPQAAAPDDWTNWHSGDPALQGQAGTGTPIPAQWWTLLGDPVLDRLVQQAMAASPDLQTAALHFAQARVQQGVVAAAGQPQVSAQAQVSRNPRARTAPRRVCSMLSAAIGIRWRSFWPSRSRFIVVVSTPRGSRTCGAASKG